MRLTSKPELLDTSETELSPLDQIRQTEADMLRRTVLARESADQILTTARRQAIQLKKKANQEGKQKGKVRHQEIIIAAEEEAKELVDEAKKLAVELRQKGNRRMESAVLYAVNYITGLGGGYSRDEY